LMISLYFFFQAEDGIRDKLVTGVQTCALPICFQPWAQPGAITTTTDTRTCFSAPAWGVRSYFAITATAPSPMPARRRALPSSSRSEERRVGKECRCRLREDDCEKKEVSVSGRE